MGFRSRRGLDAIMIAPARQLVAELNRRAREHRLDHSTATVEVALADGNQASVGDVISHPPQRPPTPPHCHRVGENGDRWTILMSPNTVT